MAGARRSFVAVLIVSAGASVLVGLAIQAALPQATGSFWIPVRRVAYAISAALFATVGSTVWLTPEILRARGNSLPVSYACFAHLGGWLTLGAVASALGLL